MDGWNTIVSFWNGLFSGAMLVSGGHGVGFMITSFEATCMLFCGCGFNVECNGTLYHEGHGLFPIEVVKL